MAVAASARCLVASAVLVSLACSGPASSPSGPISIVLQPTPASAAAFVRVTGLSPTELASLPRNEQHLEAWPAILLVTVNGSDIPVIGRYVVGDAAIEFHPRFPFDPGRSYGVTFDGSRLGTSRTPAVTHAVVSLPRPAETEPVVVSAIHPAQNFWPENLLRFYIHFSGPMSQSSGVGRIHLVAEDGEDVPNALLPLAVDLWNEDRTRYTVFFDPGRVKRGILPNRQMGRALVSGRRYAVIVDADWHDAMGRPLQAPYRHEFTAGPPIEQPLDTRSWRIAAPAAGTKGALVVTFPTLMDRALMLRTIGVSDQNRQPVAGEAETAGEDTEWRFTPRDPWRHGSFDLVIAAVLEDPAGNRINRAFEIDASKEPERPEQDEYRVRFKVSSEP